MTTKLRDNDGQFRLILDETKPKGGRPANLLIPKLMKKYQTENERELAPEATADLFRRSGFDARCEMYDLGSSPLAGLLPGWRVGYQMARWADDWLLQAAPLRALGSNFEIIARRFDERQ